MGYQRLLNRAWHRAERGLVQHHVDAADGLPAHFSARDVPLDEPEAGPSPGADEVAYLVEVLVLAGGEVVDTHDVVAVAEEPLDLAFHPVGRNRCLAHRELLALQGDARMLAPRLFRAGSLAVIHVHFPDPWWKRRHHRRRLVDEGMSTLLLRLLRPGGLLDFRTDVERYALEAIERLEAEGFENEAGRGTFADAPPDEIPSTREKRYVATGQRVWRLRLRRPA